MLQKIFRFGATAAVTSLASIAILFSVAHFDVAEAQKSRAAAIACGKEMQNHCSGVFIFGNNALECLKRDRDKLSKKCAALADNIVRACDRDAAQLCGGNVLGQGKGLACLTTARRSVSRRCNAALDAAYIR